MSWKIDKTLSTLLKNARARCVLLVDKDGSLLAKAGKRKSDDAHTVSLIAGSFAATRNMARLLGEKHFSILFHRGREENVQLSLVGDRTILAVIFTDQTTLGMVRLYAGQVAAKLSELLNRERQDGDPFGSSGPPPAPA